MFGKLFGAGKKSLPSGPAKLSTAITDSILNFVGAKSIPPMPGAAQKAFKLSTDPNAEARDFIEVIESDEALSARVIKIANSVFFDRGKQSQTIEESVLVIGINELRSLLSSSTLSDIFPSKHPARAVFWAHDIATALIARTLAQPICPSQAEIAFLGGLMHDVGKLLLLQRSGEDYSKIIKIVEEQGIDFCRAEEQVFLFTHTEVGQLIADKWNFTPELMDIIRNHHMEWNLIENCSVNHQLIAVVKAADCFAHALGLGHSKGLGRFRNYQEKCSAEAFEYLKIPSPQQKEMFANFQKTFESEFDLYAGK